MTDLQLPVRACGDDLLTRAVSDASAAQRLAAALREDASWLEVVPGVASVVVRYDPLREDLDSASARLAGTPPVAESTRVASDEPVRIAVRYGGEHGPDLTRVCEVLDLPAQEFIARHVAAAGRVELLGFTPGFAYVGGLDARLATARLAEPRERVPAGSIGVSTLYTGVYALDGPGGWPIVGRTLEPLFDASGAVPFRLLPGMPVHFVVADD